MINIDVLIDMIGNVFKIARLKKVTIPNPPKREYQNGNADKNQDWNANFQKPRFFNNCQ